MLRDVGGNRPARGGRGVAMFAGATHNGRRMARRKGKSGRRIKDWHQRYVSGEEEGGTAARRGKLSARGVKLPPSRLDSPDGRADVSLEDLARAEGLVIGVFARGALVRIDRRELFCGIAKTFRAPEDASALAVGDDVTVALTRAEHADAAAEDGDRADGMILSRRARETALARPRPRSGKRRDAYDDEIFDKVIAANMDVLLVVAAACDPPLRHGLIDRFLIIAERGELTPVLAINKIDLARPDTPDDRRVLDDFRALGIDIFFCSARTGEGLDALRAALAAKRSVLAGASGVGKSTLINAMVPSAAAATRTVRLKDQRGRHTTSAASVYDLPGGGLLVDTPGIRELGMKLDVEELPWYFPEFEQRAQACHFNDCTHTHEPDCAIRAAVEGGKIPPRRYASYLRLRETLDDV